MTLIVRGHIVMALVLAAARLEAQPRTAVQIEVAGLYALPQGSSKDFLGNHAFGGEIGLGVHFGRIPLLLGVEWGFTQYDSVRLPDSADLSGVQTVANIKLTHLVARVGPGQGAIRPYLDVLVGFSQPTATISGHETTTSIGFSEAADTSTRKILSYGAGAGLIGRVYNGLHKTGGLRTVSVDLQARYLSLSEGDFVQRGSIHSENGQLAFDTVRTRAHLFNLGFGIILGF